MTAPAEALHLNQSTHKKERTLVMRALKSKRVTKCLVCKSMSLTHIEIDPETLDESAEWDQFTDGYKCGECNQVSHMSDDGVECISHVHNEEVQFNKTSDFGSGLATASYVTDQQKSRLETEPA